jgi:hypothetical protein
MIKFFKKMVLFSFFAMFLYLALVIAWGSIFEKQAYKKNLSYRTANYGHQFSRIKEIKTARDINLLFLGSSHTYRGFDTRIFRKAGFDAYNMGSSSQSHIQSELLLKRYLDNLNPKMVVYEVYPGLFTVDGIESSLNLMGNDSNDFETVKTAFKLPHFKIFNTLIYGLFTDFIGKNDNLIEYARKDYQDTYVAGGYVQRDLRFYKNTTHPSATWELKESQLQAFENCILMLKKRGILYQLVQAPVTQAYYKSHTNNVEFDSLMTTYGDYTNFNNISVLNDSLHFFDEHHLNQDGVEVFNGDVLEILGLD